ncbi:hypothetical protein JTE90_008793 [Oedothorax gibbosus]|uniref:C2H2-type domain-containing protein n=1 Tax=Oedothorax gibbosus TaxID=931172 RepID=A0AAV6V4X7_9ARAC|nr:hypothetical protein JTE90_008793 [Oedothorax gibbosus]
MACILCAELWTGYQEYEKPTEQIPVELLPFLSKRPGLCIFESKPAAPSPKQQKVTVTPRPQQPPQRSQGKEKPMNPPESNQAYHCEFCPFVANSIQQFKLHLDQHKNAPPQQQNVAQCQICLQVFKSTTALRSHMLTHTNTQQHVCQYCEKKFKTAATLRNHVRMLHLGEQHVCPICDKVFNNDTYFRRHMMSHQQQQ